MPSTGFAVSLNTLMLLHYKNLSDLNSQACWSEQGSLGSLQMMVRKIQRKCNYLDNENYHYSQPLETPVNSETFGLDFSSTLSLGQMSSIPGKWERKGRKKNRTKKVEAKQWQCCLSAQALCPAPEQQARRRKIHSKCLGYTPLLMPQFKGSYLWEHLTFPQKLFFPPTI